MENSLTSEYLSPAQAAAFLGRSVKTLANYRHKGTGPAYRKRGRIYYLRSDLIAWLDGARRTSTSKAMHEAHV